MVRERRVEYAGARYHIVSRGNRKDLLFFDDFDRIAYLEMLEDAKGYYPFKIHAYCLMSNHIHLLIETETPTLSSIMHRLNSCYAHYFNNRHQFVGHVFQGRYKAKIVQDSYYLLDVSKYIHLNPTRAKLARKPENYQWSSYSSYYSSEKNPLVTTTLILSHFPKDSAKHYQKFIEQGI